jgi:hypothetical protein
VACQAHGLHFIKVDCWFWGIGCRVTARDQVLLGAPPLEL